MSNPARSIVDYLTIDDEDMLMPPKSHGGPLSAERVGVDSSLDRRGSDWPEDFEFTHDGKEPETCFDTTRGTQIVERPGLDGTGVPASRHGSLSHRIADRWGTVRGARLEMAFDRHPDSLWPACCSERSQQWCRR